MKKQYLIVSFVVSVLFVPMLANATISDEINEQIQSLLSQITSLQSQLSSLPSSAAAIISTTSNSCPKLYRTLSRGSRGSDVVSLQKFLVTQGHLNSDLATGLYGPATEKAVQLWQTQNAIVANGSATSTGYGVVGTRTRAAITTQCKKITQIICPLIAPPQCTNGTLISLGTDINGCSKGYQCKQTQMVCPIIAPPTQCTNGTLISLGMDANGCSRGYQCVASTSTPAIKIISAQVLGSGSELSVSWQSSSAPTGATISLSLIPVSGGEWAAITANKPTTGNFTWKIPDTYCHIDVCGMPLKSGLYLVRAWIVSGGRSVATSDSSQFSIFVDINSGSVTIPSAGGGTSVYSL